MAQMQRCYAERLENIHILSDKSATRAAAEYIVHGRYIATADGLPEAKGQSYILPGGAFFEVAGGRITRVTNYYNLQDWLAQVSA